MIKSPRIMISITHDQMTRLMVYSGVIEHLAQLGAEVTILTPEGEKSPLRDLFRNQKVTLDALPKHREWLAHYWYRIYRYLFLTLIPTYASQAQIEHFKRYDPVRYWIVTIIPARFMKFLERLWVTVRRLLFPAQLYGALFEKYNPDLVVVGSMGRFFEDYYLLRLSQLSKIRSLCSVQSWDRLTTKEFELERPQRLVVWNPANRGTAVEAYNYDPDEIAVVGVPQFDFYLKPSSFESRENWFLQYGFDSNRELLFITGQGGHVHQNLHQLLEALAFGIANDCFVKPVQVLVRPHPAVYFGQTPGEGTEVDLRRYEALNPYIKGNRPRHSAMPIATDTSADEHLVLANNLYHSAMLIDFYGTLSVEACVVNRPVIYADPHASFAAGPVSAKPEQQGIDYSQYEHIQYILSMSGTRTARTRDELYEEINRYLENPTLDSEGRKRIAEAFCYKLDGRSSERMANVIYQYAQGKWTSKLITKNETYIENCRPEG